MKRKGFTLAEILITLGIVGVVAALTAPALVKNTAGAKVGPTLAKVVNTMEVANEQLMLDKNISDLRKVYVRNVNINDYFNDLSKYIRKSAYNSTKRTTIYQYNATHSPTTVWGYPTGEFLLPEGASIYLLEAYAKPFSSNCCSATSHKERFLGLLVDINGSQSGNNMIGDDVFMFILNCSGSMIPWGSQIYINNFTEEGNMSEHWSQACNSEQVVDAQSCAGSIFENNLKIIYQ